MGVVLLAVSSDYSSSGITDQGSSDFMYQSEVGAPLPCPGVFPCRIASTSRVGGTSTSVVAQVYAGSNHLLIQEYLHNATAYAGNSVRTETIHKSLKIVGGTFTEDPTTETPVIAPYYSAAGLLSTSLTGISAHLRSLSLTGYPIVATNISTSGDATASNNYYTFKDEFNKKPNRSYLRDGAHFFLETPIPTTPQFISINLSSKTQDDYANFRATNSTADLRPYNSVQMLPFPIISNGTDLIDRVTSTTTTRAQKVTANLLITIRNIQGLRCFNPTSSLNTYGGVDLKPGVSGEEITQANKILALAIYDSEPRESSAPDEVDGFYTFAGIRADGSPFLGMFAQPLANPAAHFFQTGWQQNILYSGLRPAFGYDSTLQSVDTVPGVPRVNSYWAGAYPVGARFNTYSDVQSTQYGFVFLNSVTKHLEFLFKPYFESGNVSPTLGVINKLLHPPPRSVDYIPAVNMKLGISPLNPTGPSVYKTTVNGGLVEGYFGQSSMLHGGGGHLMAMGTFNGALIHQGRVVVWGSNRWGQCVIPTPITAANITLVDVAVANSPPVLVAAHDDSIYSDSMAEFKARDYTKPDEQDASYGADPYYYSYPPIHHTRHGRHINYTNLPGHVVVVTAAGWVYAWGNNKYNQCDVPDEISLIAANGSVRNDTDVPPDPISEVSAGAFHTVARSRAGRLYVWGAGNPNTTISAALDGRVTSSSLSDVYPTTDSSSNKKVSKCVHFGQSTLWVNGQTSLGSGGLATPTPTPLGLSSLTSEDYPASGLTAVYGATLLNNVTAATKTINSISTVVGHKTAAGFCPADTAALRCKGLIAAGAFHTAVIDSALKIQCVGAGRGPVENTSTGILFNAVVGTDLQENTAQWGSSYTTGDNPYQFSSTYPHYCQGLNQYQAPFPTAASPNTNPHLFRYPTVVSTASVTQTEKKHLIRFFQDVTFKKVT